MEIYDPNTLTLSKLHSLLQSSIVPRPIALASTVDHAGNVNLSPFSFFNIFSSRPPILVFSPARRGRDNTIKHTYENVLEVPEVVINIVDFAMVHQTSLASVEYPRDINEFIKSGLTPVSAKRIRPPRVAESPVAFECAVKQVIPLGDEGGAGNLVICEILLIHVREGLTDERGAIDPQKLDAVARMGNDFYCRASGDAIFTVPKPTTKLGIGYDQLPEHVRKSAVLTGNDLGQLGNVERLPDAETILQFRNSEEGRKIAAMNEEVIHRLAQKKLKRGDVEGAWRVLIV